MGSKPVNNAPLRPEVPTNKTRICIAGFSISSYTGRARRIASLIAKKYPDQYETWYYFDSGSNYYEFLRVTFDSVPFPQHLKGHSSSPFVWLENNEDNQTNKMTLLGPCSALKEWAKTEFKNDKEIVDCCSVSFTLGDIFHNGGCCCGEPEPDTYNRNL